jgi:uncharacterized Ntn-hydrolase superfamily protein
VNGVNGLVLQLKLWLKKRVLEAVLENVRCHEGDATAKKHAANRVVPLREKKEDYYNEAKAVDLRLQRHDDSVLIKH